MGEDGCGSRKWEENMYWSHFQTVQFFQTLTGRYNQQLAIPQKFVNNLREKLAGDVKLRGPSGVVWNVGITAFASTWYFKTGWKEFVEDHSLEENDVLIFKYTGNSRFDVQMFDQKSLCEKEGAYFIKRCDNENVEAVGSEKRKEKSPPMVEHSNESSHEIYACASSKKRRMDDIGKTSRSVGSPSRVNANKRSKSRRTYKALAKRSSVSGPEFLSRRTPVTDEAKRKALNRAIADAAKSEASFVMVMRRSHIHYGFYMNFPSEWTSEHLKCRSQCKYVTLQFEGKTWQANVGRRENGYCGLAGGWRNFATENDLEENDVLAFNLVSATADTITLNIRIFRVGENSNIQQDMPAAPAPAPALAPAPAPRVIVGGVGRGRKKKAKFDV